LAVDGLKTLPTPALKAAVVVDPPPLPLDDALADVAPPLAEPVGVDAFLLLLPQAVRVSATTATPANAAVLGVLFIVQGTPFSSW
jgi:hypothetical protein